MYPWFVSQIPGTSYDATKRLSGGGAHQWLAVSVSKSSYWISVSDEGWYPVPRITFSLTLTLTLTPIRRVPRVLLTLTEQGGAGGDSQKSQSRGLTVNGDSL